MIDGKRSHLLLMIIAIVGIVVFLLPSLIDTGFTRKTFELATQALGISLFITPISIFLTLFLSTRMVERKLDTIAQRIVHTDHPLETQGITAIYHDRSLALTEFLTRCKGAEQIDIMGVCLPQLINHDTFLAKCAEKPDVHVRIIMLDEKAEILQDCIDWFFPNHQAGLDKQAQGNIERLTTLRDQGVEVHKYSTWPMASIMRVDDVMFYSPYIYCTRGAESPAFRLVREIGKENELFNIILEAFETVIQRTIKADSSQNET